MKIYPLQRNIFLPVILNFNHATLNIAQSSINVKIWTHDLVRIWSNTSVKEKGYILFKSYQIVVDV